MSVFKSLTAGALLIVATAAGARTVPEPATWAMMVGGFALVGIVRRRDRRRSVVA